MSTATSCHSEERSDEEPAVCRRQQEVARNDKQNL